MYLIEKEKLKNNSKIFLWSCLIGFHMASIDIVVREVAKVLVGKKGTFLQLGRGGNLGCALGFC